MDEKFHSKIDDLGKTLTIRIDSLGKELFRKIDTVSDLSTRALSRTERIQIEIGGFKDICNEKHKLLKPEELDRNSSFRKISIWMLGGIWTAILGLLLLLFNK
jgi:hypothetical protein